ncbi:MAG: hypothetical protein U1E65_00750 [Myxococcota bacterium]
MMWEKGLAYPFLRPPSAAVIDEVPEALRDENWQRVNHAAIPSLYPPLSSLVFALAARIGDLFGGRYLLSLKLMLVLLELAALSILARAGVEASVLAACPLLIFEVAREGHHDSVALLGLALFVLGARRLSPRLAHAGLALASLGKLFALALHPLTLAWSRRGAIVPGALLLLLLPLPLFFGGLEASLGLRTYASAWRAGDGAFSLILWIAESLPLAEPEAAARAAVAVLYLAFLAWCLLSRASLEQRTARALTLLLLLSPTLHPWYALWILPLVEVSEGGAAVALLALVPLFHAAGWLELTEGAWRVPAGLRAAVHLPVWALWLSGMVRACRSSQGR